MKRTALIMAGGKGTRLYPLSTEDKPKQFLPLLSEKPMLVETIDRLIGLFSCDEIVINSIEQYREKVEEIAEKMKVQTLIEPSGKGTMLSVLYSCFLLKDSVIALIPSDHYINRIRKYHEALEKGMELAEFHNRIVTIGIEPTHAETGYGYIKHSGKVVMEFVEKPSEEKAHLYLAMDYKWNSGIFIFKASTMIEEYRKFHPFFTDLLESFIEQGDIQKAYRILKKDTVEKAIIEQTGKLGMIRGQFGWSDVGTMDRLEKVRAVNGEWLEEKRN